MRSFVYVLSAAVFAVGCSDPNSTAVDDAGVDADARADASSRCARGQAPSRWIAPDAGASEGGLPSLPLVQTQGAGVLASPTFVGVTFDGDDQRAPLEDFLATVGCTPYWREIADDYGVGDGIAGVPIHVSTAAPAATDATQIRAFVKGLAQADTDNGAATDRVYVVFYPATTKITYQGVQSCLSFRGYHDTVKVGSTDVAYAVLARCQPSLATLTSVTSHELVEAATDPLPLTGYGTLSDLDLAWGIFGGAEVADLCDFGKAQSLAPPGFAYTVQRSWSNRAAFERRDPCVPAVGKSFFVAAPSVSDLVPFTKGLTTTMTRGLKLAVGQSRTIDVVLTATSPVADWKVTASDLSPSLGASPALELSLDASTGNAGKTLHLTVKRLGSEPNSGVAPFLLLSEAPDGEQHGWLAVVGD